MLRRILFTRQIDGPESPLNAVVLFSDIITPKGQMQQHPSQHHPSRSHGEKTLRLIYPPASGMEPEQSSLYRRDIRSHSNPGNRFFPPSLPLCLLHRCSAPFSAVSLSSARLTIIFTAWHLRANNTLPARVHARARDPMHRKPEPRRNLPLFAAVENVTSALS